MRASELAAVRVSRQQQCAALAGRRRSACAAHKKYREMQQGGAYAVRGPPTLPKAAQSRRRPQSRSRLPNPTPDCGHLEASATHQRSAVNAGRAVIAEAAAAAAETTSQPLCALLDHSPSAVARVRYRAILTPT